ncbi:MAG: response regulator [bacterium]|nr:response regulator [bacterium]MCP5031951.1 response regulator [Actinomycetes bacterium]
MTVTETEAESMSSMLAKLWQRHRVTNLDRITILEQSTANVLRGCAEAEELEEAAKAAHKLAGSLGTFGLDAGSRAALEAETILGVTPIDGRLLAEAVSSLRTTVEQRGDEPTPAAEPAPEPTSQTDALVRIISEDADLISRLSLAGAAAGVAVASSRPTSALDVADAMSVIIDAGHSDLSANSAIAEQVADLSTEVPVVVLTEEDTFEQRMVLTRAGASAVIPRSNAARLAIGYLLEIRAQRTPHESQVIVLQAESGQMDKVLEALSEDEMGYRLHTSAESFWTDLEEDGADLVVLDGQYEDISVPELCRVLRSHPRWQQLPVIAYGPRRTALIREALASGADDYLSSQVPAAELGCRLRTFVERTRTALARSDIDPLTGAENRDAAERSIDHYLRLAGRRDEPFAFVRVIVDQLDEISEAEGAVLSDIVFRRLGSRLLSNFRNEDVVSRWTGNEFVVGMYGATRDIGARRIAEVLADFRNDEFRTTSGIPVRYDFRAGVSCYPTDGSTLASLERMSETALERAVRSGDRIVVTGAGTGTGAGAGTNEGGKIDVVLVEDDDSIADIVEHTLSLRGYSFRRFDDGAEAASALSDGRIQGRIVLLDVGLPSLDGFGVLKQLGSHGVLDVSHVIMLTARSSEAEMLRALGLGATEHITKPFSVPLLLGRLDQVLGGTRV